MRVAANRLGVLYRYFLILFIAIVTACAQAPVASAPATQQVVTVALPAALKPIAAAIKSCAANQPGISLFIDDPNNETSSASDLNLSLGEPVSPLEFSASLAVEDLVVIINQANKLADLSTDVLRRIYTGQMSHWDELSSCQGEIQVWDYPGSDPLHHFFDQAVLKGSPVTGMAYLAPDPSAMLESISTNPGAIGYLPRAWLSGNKIKPLTLDADASTALRLPVLALAAHEPQGYLRTFVACLQTGSGHTIIMQHYPSAKP